LRGLWFCHLSFVIAPKGLSLAVPVLGQRKNY
jgi:hypothetical protein